MKKPTIEPSRVEVPAVTQLAQSLGLLLLVGLALGICVASLRSWDVLAEFVSNNQTPNSARKRALSSVLGLTLGLPLVTSLYFVYRGPAMKKLETLSTVALRLAPLGPLALVPWLFHESMWEARPLAFYVTSGFISVLFTTSLRCLPAPAEGSEFAWLGALGRTRLPRWVRYGGLVGLMALVLVATAWRYHEIGSSLSLSLTRERELLLRLMKGSDGFLELWSRPFATLGHACLEIPLVAVLFEALPQLEVLLVLRVGLVVSGVIPLVLWSRRLLGANLALCVGFAYLMLPLVHQATFSEPFPLALALPFYFSAANAWDRHHNKTAIVLSLLTVLFNEQAAWWFLPFAFYLARERGGVYRALGLAVGSMGYFLLVQKGVLEPLGAVRYAKDFSGAFSRPEPGLWQSLLVPLNNPGFALGRWFETQTLGFWLAVWVPLGFVPLGHRRAVLWLLPSLVFVILATGRSQGVAPAGQYLAHFVAMGFSAAIVVLSAWRSADPEHGARRSWATMAGWLVATVAAAYQFGSLVTSGS